MIMERIEDVLTECMMTSVGGAEIEGKMGYSSLCNFLIRVAPQYNNLDDLKALILSKRIEIVEEFGSSDDYVQGYLKACSDVMELIE